MNLKHAVLIFVRLRIILPVFEYPDKNSGKKNRLYLKFQQFQSTTSKNILAHFRTQKQPLAPTNI